MDKISAIATLKQAIILLQEIVEIDCKLEQNLAAWALAIADGLNFSAKQAHGKRKTQLYQLKVPCINAALFFGCDGGWGLDEEGKDLFFLHTLDIGVASFHEPRRQSKIASIAVWPEPWNGIKRQKWALPALERESIRKLMAKHLHMGAHPDPLQFQAEALAEYPEWKYADI